MSPSQIEEALQLAGFLSAHGIWCVSDGSPLIPMFGEQFDDGSRQMSRLAADKLEDGVAQGRQLLESNAGRAARAVLLYDGYVTLPSGKTDALFAVIRSYQAQHFTVSMAIPYRNAANAKGFAVHRPKFLDCDGIETPNYGAMGDSFFRGVDTHEKGLAVWNAASDPSV